LAQRIEARSAQLWNLYGPTETTVWSTLSRVEGGRVTLGRPLANTQLHVLDAGLRPLPPGVPGELCIGGMGAARGYHHRPDLTGERFVHTQWGRLYRTGDRVRLLASGELEWIGRSDNQIKLRGYRIELGEIEARILEHPGVRAAAVAANPELTAYVVGPTESLRDHLSGVLPAYMVPSRVRRPGRTPADTERQARSRRPSRTRCAASSVDIGRSGRGGVRRLGGGLGPHGLRAR
jgi:acyl-coenzyme A synthetase/AMP-(fatty) acid ligase